MKHAKISYVKLFEIDVVDGQEWAWEICTFAGNPVISGEVARAMKATHPESIFELRDFNENDEVIGKYRPY